MIGRVSEIRGVRVNQRNITGHTQIRSLDGTISSIQSCKMVSIFVS